MTVATAGSEAASLALARAWVEALNRRDAEAMAQLIADDFTYSGMARTPPELGVRLDRAAWLQRLQQSAGAMRRPVNMTIVRGFADGDQAVVEAEGYGERRDGGVYANGYCLVFETRDGRVAAVRDYCCTSTALAHFQALAAG